MKDNWQTTDVKLKKKINNFMNLSLYDWYDVIDDMCQMNISYMIGKM